jgi:hypothetical protein
VATNHFGSFGKTIIINSRKFAKNLEKNWQNFKTTKLILKLGHVTFENINYKDFLRYFSIIG